MTRRQLPQREPQHPDTSTQHTDGKVSEKAREATGVVIVANRLPVEQRPDGTLGRSPGGLASALAAVASEGSHWIGWAGPDASQADLGDEYLHHVELSPREVDRVLPRLRQLVAVAALPRPPPPARDEPDVVARVPDGERTLCRGRRPDRAAQRTRVGPRLPPPAHAGDDPRPPARTSGSGCSCTSRSRLSICSRRCRGAATWCAA